MDRAILSAAMAKRQSAAAKNTPAMEEDPAASLQADYTILGTVTSGLDVVDKVEKGGSDDANAKGDGHPKIEVDIKSLTMSAA